MRLHFRSTVKGIANMNFANIVKQNKSDIAFVVGNGINRFDSANTGNSWDELLIELWNKYAPDNHTTMPAEIAATEFFDLLQLRLTNNPSSIGLAKEFCELMGSWQPSIHHKNFIAWAIENQSPVLTTNFENTLGEAGECELRRIATSKFTDYYPWGCCYSDQPIANAIDHFAIWHINGMQRYQRSIRLGLTHYMGSVERARKWFYRGKNQSLFFGKNNRKWDGAETWLQVIFNKPIAIFGLELGQTEVFLRWLLIERAKYFNKFPERRKKAWYIHTEKSSSSGKLMFFESLGITPVKATSYEQIYVKPW